MTRSSGPPVKAIMVDLGMTAEDRPTGRAEAGDDIDDAGRKAGLMNQPGEFEQRRRPVFRRLHNHGAAGRKRRADLAAERKSWLFHGTTMATTPIGSAKPHIHVRLVDRR